MNTPSTSDPLAAAMDPAGAAAHPTPAELAPHVPEFEILAVLRYGGMGAVYKVRRHTDQAILALKVVRPATGQTEAFITRFAREAEALERLDHPHIVAIHDHGQAGPWCWLLMDLIDGANLRQIVSTGRLSPAQTLALVPPLCAALQYAHDQGVVHRDLKPENILLDAAGVPHLVDFGLAKLSNPKVGSGLTHSGVSMGTVHYMAPEQVASAKGVDHRADIYALGVVIYELLTGQLPLGRFESPSQRVQVDVRIDEVVLKALERDPERRWQQMRLVGEAVAAVDRATFGPSPPPRPWPWPSRTYQTLLAVAGVSLIGAVNFFYLSWVLQSVVGTGCLLAIGYIVLRHVEHVRHQKLGSGLYVVGSFCFLGIVLFFSTNPKAYWDLQERSPSREEPLAMGPAVSPLFDQSTTEAEKTVLQAKLAQRVTINHDDADLFEVLKPLLNAASINYTIEPPGPWLLKRTVTVHAVECALRGGLANPRARGHVPLPFLRLPAGRRT